VPNKKSPHIIDVSWLVTTLIVDFLAIFNTTHIKATFTLVIVISIMVGEVGPTFIRNYSFRFRLELVLAYSWGSFQTWFLNDFEFFRFWCSQSVSTKFPKDSHGIPIKVLLNSQGVPNVSKAFPNMFPKNNNKEQCKDHKAQHICVKGHYNTVMGDALYIKFRAKT